MTFWFWHMTSNGLMMNFDQFMFLQVVTIRGYSDSAYTDIKTNKYENSIQQPHCVQNL